jgi:hypothetical protein
MRCARACFGSCLLLMSVRQFACGKLARDTAGSAIGIKR